MLIPLCPECGCPARCVSMRLAYVLVELNEDGSKGRIVRTAGTLRPDPEPRYVCGGGHEWKKLPDR